MNKKQRISKLLFLLVIILLLTACGRDKEPTPAPSAVPATPVETACQVVSTPTPTPESTVTARPSATPESTATARPSATPKPTRTARPTATPPGYFGDPENGWAIQFPSDWESASTYEAFPAAIFWDVESELIMWVGWDYYSEAQTPAEMAEMISEMLTLDLDEWEQTPVTEIALKDGTPAFGVIVTGYDPDQGKMQVKTVLARRGARIYFVIAVAPIDVFEIIGRTIDAVIGSLSLSALRPYDIDRDTALILAAGEPYNMDPATTESHPSAYMGYVFSGLVTFNANLQVVPDLAQRWDISDDGRTYTFYLHPDAMFHDGKPVTAADFKYAWERAADPETGSTKASTYLGDIVGVQEKLDGQADEISGVVVIDEHTLQVIIDEPKVYFLAKLNWPVAFVVDRENIERRGVKDWWRTPNGSGPFRLAQWEDDVIIFARNENYYGPMPKLEHIVYLLQTGSAFRLYESGDVDMAGVPLNFIERVQDPSDPLHGDLRTTVGLCVGRLGLDNSRPPFDDPLVRQAFSYAIDREKVIQVTFKGAVESAIGPLPPGMPGYSGELVGYSFDPERALEMIAQSSYGEPSNLPPITFTSSGYTRLDADKAAIIKTWQDVFGIEIQAELLEPKGYVYELKERHGHIFAHSWCADYPDPQNFLDVLYHSTSEENTGKYNNPVVDALLAQARTEQDITARLALYQQAEQIIVDDAAEIWTYHRITRQLIKPYVKGYVLTQLGVQQSQYIYLDPH